MNILQVNYTDLPGRIFDGYDLHLALNREKENAYQVVINKRSKMDTVIQLDIDRTLHTQLKIFEKNASIQNLVFPYAQLLEQLDVFQKADIVHYHILHNRMFSLLDYPRLMNQKKSVWTIHDPWIITGNCVYPLECDKWKCGCGKCERLDEPSFQILQDNTNFMWNVKKEILKQVNPHIVVSCQFMENYLKNSPLTKHFNKIHTIPFGIDIAQYDRPLSIAKSEKFVIGFRAESALIKGGIYLYHALEKIKRKERFLLVSTGNGQVPDNIKREFQVIELGWMDDAEKMIEFYRLCDVFVMPSLAESFGLMAIEAMAAQCPVVCFKTTILEDIINAPECGIAVEYKSSKELMMTIEELEQNREKATILGKRAHEYVATTYRFEDYVQAHKQLYQQIYEEDNT